MKTYLVSYLITLTFVFSFVGFLFSWAAAVQVAGVIIVATVVLGIIGLIIYFLTTPRGPCIG